MKSSDPLYVVRVWNADHTRSKIWKNCTTQERADEEKKALRLVGLEAEVITVGAVNVSNRRTAVSPGKTTPNIGRA